jgi:transposase
MVELVRAGRSPEELSREFEPTAQSIRNWLTQSERNAGRDDGGLTTAEREELSRLRRENRQLRLEREILSKAAAWFAREGDTRVSWSGHAGGDGPRRLLLGPRRGACGHWLATADRARMAPRLGHERGLLVPFGTGHDTFASFIVAAG